MYTNKTNRHSPRCWSAIIAVAFSASCGVTLAVANNDCMIAETFEMSGTNTQRSDTFGADVESDGARLIVSSSGHNNDIGGAYVYDINPATGALTNEAILSPSKAMPVPFGITRVAISGNIAVLAMPNSDHPDGILAAGVVYIFEFIGGSWVEQSTIYPSTPSNGLLFGWAIKLQGNLLAVGAIGDQTIVSGGGAVTLIEVNGNSWNELATLRPAFSIAGQLFGNAVTIDGNHIAVSAPGVVPGNGRAFIFENLKGTWTETATVTPPPNDNINHLFGINLDLQGDTLIVGNYVSPAANDDFGAAFIYRHDINTNQWIEQARLQPDDLVIGDEFGLDVALNGNGDVAFVGAPWGTFVEPAGGTVRRFVRANTCWIESGVFGDAAPDVGVHLGSSITVPGNGAWLYAGAPWSDAGGFITKRGSVFAFDTSIPCPAMLADLSGDGNIDVIDLLILLNNWQTNKNGAAIAAPFDIVDVFDLLVLLSAWGDC